MFKKHAPHRAQVEAANTCLLNMRHMDRGKIRDLLFGEEDLAPGSFFDSL